MCLLVRSYLPTAQTRSAGALQAGGQDLLQSCAVFPSSLCILEAQEQIEQEVQIYDVPSCAVLPYRLCRSKEYTISLFCRTADEQPANDKQQNQCDLLLQYEHDPCCLPQAESDVRNMHVKLGRQPHFQDSSLYLRTG